MPNNINEILELFEASVMKKADQDREQIYKEVEDHRKEELSKIESRVLQESYRDTFLARSLEKMV